MAVSHGRTAYFAVGTPSGGAVTPLSAYTNGVSGLPGDQDLGAVAAFGDYGYTQLPGLQNGAFTSEHPMNTNTSGTTTAWSWLSGFQSIQRTYASATYSIQYGPAGSTAGYPLVTCNALIKNIALNTKVTDPNAFTVSWQVTGSTGVTVGVLS